MSVTKASMPDGGGGSSPDVSRLRMYLMSIQASSFKSLLETLKELLHDCLLEFDSTGVRVMTIEGSRCALVHLRLDASAFEKFHCPQKYDAGINCGAMYKLIKACSPNDTIEFSATYENTDVMDIQIKCAERNSTTRYSLKLLDIDSESIQIPDAEFERALSLPSAYFSRVCRDMQAIGDYMTIRTEPDGRLILTCDGDWATQTTELVPSSSSNGDGENNVPGAPGSAATLTIDGDIPPPTRAIEATYPLKFLGLFARASSLCSTVQVFIRHDFPLILSYRCASMGTLKFALVARAHV